MNQRGYNIKDGNCSTLGRFKTIVGIDRTSIQKFLDSLLKSFRKYAEDDWSYNMAKDIIKEDLRDGDPDFWEDFQKGGDYPGGTSSFIAISNSNAAIFFPKF
jgi:hypothetical protein